MIFLKKLILWVLNTCFLSSWANTLGSNHTVTSVMVSETVSVYVEEHLCICIHTEFKINDCDS